MSFPRISGICGFKIEYILNTGVVPIVGPPNPAIETCAPSDTLAW